MTMKAYHRAATIRSESQLFFKNNLFELFFELFGGTPNKYMHIYNIKSISIFCMVYHQIVNLTSVQSLKVVQKYFGYCITKI